jgi:hypothetical protein
MDTPVKPSGEIVNNKWNFEQWKASKKAAGTWTGGENADPTLSKPAPFQGVKAPFTATKAPYAK